METAKGKEDTQERFPEMRLLRHILFSPTMNIRYVGRAEVREETDFHGSHLMDAGPGIWGMSLSPSGIQYGSE